MTVTPGPAPVMTREEADRAITQLEADCTRFADTLVTTVESHPGYQYLRTHPVTGRTQDVRQEQEQCMRLLWAYHHVLSSTLQSARRVRDRRDRTGHAKLVELTRLLRDGVVGLGTDGMPVEPDTSAPVERVSLTVLSSRLDQACADAVAVLTRVDQASLEVATRLSALAGALGQLRTAAATVGARQDPTIDRLLTTFTELSRAAVDDPLGTVTTGSAAAGAAGPADVALRALEADVNAAGQRLADLSALRHAYPKRMEALRRLVDAVGTAEDVAHQAYSAATAKIMQPGLAPPAGQVGELRAGLADVERYERANRWQRIAQVLPMLERAGEAALGRAQEREAAANALLARRDELRGRLDSYRVKADHLGLGEHAELSRAYRAAWDLLWTAPCALPAAARAVWRYQELLANPPDDEGDATP
ncbi:MAG TPA: hypothetical protein VFM54_24090 [Micromonosporaceae bacterium]|nr:hypothetical protein [Micromonosporaceae bacterium]